MNSCKPPWWNRHPRAGFRLSPTDLGIIAACVPVTCGAWLSVGEFALIFPIVLGHFFLFCNVFRIPRNPELVWSGMLVVNVAAWTIGDVFTWARVVLTQAPVTLAVVLTALLRDDYHGVAAAAVRRWRDHFRQAQR